MGLAYPDLPLNARERLACHHFVETLNDSEMRFQIFQGRPRNLDEALAKALEFEAICRIEAVGRVYPRATWFAELRAKTRLRGDRSSAVGTSELQQVLSEVARFKHQMQEISSRHVELDFRLWQDSNRFAKSTRQRPRGPRTALKYVLCFRCGRRGHLQRDFRSYFQAVLPGLPGSRGV